MLLFKLFTKNNPKEKEVFWVIEENEDKSNVCLLKFYDKKNKLLYQESFSWLKKEILDDSLLKKIEKIFKKVR